MSNPGVFRYFPQLPTELRLKIWSHAITPRVLEIKYHPVKCAYTSRTSQPALLHANHESREVALSIYTPCFPHSYINYALDTIYFRNNYGANPMSIIFEELSKNNVKNVRSFAIDPLFVIGPWDVCISKRWWEVFDGLPSLRQVSVVVDGTDLSDAEGDLVFKNVGGREKGPSWEELRSITLEDWDAYAKTEWAGGRPRLEFVSVART